MVGQGGGWRWGRDAVDLAMSTPEVQDDRSEPCIVGRSQSACRGLPDSRLSETDPANKRSAGPVAVYGGLLRSSNEGYRSDQGAGAVELILPAVTKIATALVPLATTGLAIAMALATVVHLRRVETRIVVNLVLLSVAVSVAWRRFGRYVF